MERLCIVIPAYQAGQLIGEVIDKIPPHFPVIVIDDGSSDDTVRVAELKGVTVLRHSYNKRKGEALKTGFEYASQQGFAFVLTMDADGQHDPAEIEALVTAQRAVDADLVIGTRLAKRGSMPLWRYGANRIGSWAISVMTGTSLSDTQCGFRIYRTSLLQGLPLTTHGFDTETELLLRFIKRRASIVQAPITTIYHAPDRALSHFQPLADTARILWLLARYMAGAI